MQIVKAMFETVHDLILIKEENHEYKERAYQNGL